MRQQLKKDSCSPVVPIVNRVYDDVMNAVAAAVARMLPRLRQRIRDLKYSSHVSNSAKADRDVGDLALRALVSWILRGQENRKPRLGKPSPRVLEQVRFEQHALGI